MQASPSVPGRLALELAAVRRTPAGAASAQVREGAGPQQVALPGQLLISTVRASPPTFKDELTAQM